MADENETEASRSEDESFSDQEVDVHVHPKSDPSCCATGPEKTVNMRV